MNRITLENDLLTVTVLPERGGKLASIRHRPTGFELLAQPPCGYPPLEPGMPFHLGDASGFDDVFPSMGPETSDGIELPDHGQIWSAPMSAELSDERVILRRESIRPVYSYEKQVWLEDDAVRLRWRIHNPAAHSLQAVWICHCLMRDEEGLRFEFPPDAREAVNLIPGSALGALGQAHRTDGADYDFSRPPQPDSAVKFRFRHPIREGRCAAVYSQSGLRAELEFDPVALPALSFWMTTGAYRGDRNFAFEPATAHCDTLEEGRRNGCRTEIPAKETLSLQMSIRLTEIE